MRPRARTRTRTHHPRAHTHRYDNYEAILRGAHDMDVHAASADSMNNMPLMLALLGGCRELCSRSPHLSAGT
ncbi:MAG: hypothetical protein ACPIOQ_33575 [Promethearchaeia archaeon]